MSNPFLPKTCGARPKSRQVSYNKRKKKVKELKVILTNGNSGETITVWNNPDLRELVLSEYKKGTSEREIAEIANKSGFLITTNSLNKFLNKRVDVLSKREITEVKDSIFYDIEKLDVSIDNIVKLLEEKIASWKDNEKKNKELLLGISQLREYQVLALKKLGIIKDAIQKVDRQFNQTNIIVAQHQTDYLKELVMDGKIKIVDSTLLDLVFGKAVNQGNNS